MTADNDNMPTDFDPRLGSGLHATYLPDWRFRRAIQFMQLGRTSTDKSVDDDLLIATAKFLREFVKADEAPYPDFAHVDLAKKMPGLYGAWFAHEYPDPGLRATIESYILAGTSPADAAQMCGMSSKVGDCYAKIFFDVVDRLDQKAYIVNVAIGTHVHRPPQPNDFPTLWKLCAYLKGRAVFEFVMFGTTEGHITDARQVRKAVEDMAADLLANKLIMSAKALDPIRDAKLVARACRRILERAGTASEKSDPSSLASALSLVESIGGSHTINRQTGAPPEAPTTPVPDESSAFSVDADQLSAADDVLPFPELEGVAPINRRTNTASR